MTDATTPTASPVQGREVTIDRIVAFLRNRAEDCRCAQRGTTIVVSDHARHEEMFDAAADLLERRQSRRSTPADTEREAIRDALKPFAVVADIYDDREDGHHQVWIDAHQREVKALTVAACQKARDALALLSSPRGERDDALEEAAKVADAAGRVFLTDRHAFVLAGPAGIVASMVRAIRALKSQSPGREQPEDRK